MVNKKIHQYKGVMMDSQEEVWLAAWMEELRLAGYIISWHRETKSMTLAKQVEFNYVKKTQLKTKVKTENKKFILLRDLTYTPDFSICWSLKGWELFGSDLTNPKLKAQFYAESSLDCTWIEVKPSFDQNNMTREFVVKQKIIFDKLKLFVNLIYPEELFEDTFLPYELIPEFIYKVNCKGGTKGEWKTKYKPRSLKEFINHATDKTS